MAKKIEINWLFRIAGGFCFLWILIQGFPTALTPVQENNNISYLIQTNGALTLAIIIRAGLLWYMAAGFLFLSFASRHARIAYWSIHLAIWVSGITWWYQAAPTLFIIPPQPWRLFVPLFCSLILLVCYSPLMVPLKRWIDPPIVSRQN